MMAVDPLSSSSRHQIQKTANIINLFHPTARDLRAIPRTRGKKVDRGGVPKGESLNAQEGQSGKKGTKNKKMKTGTASNTGSSETANMGNMAVKASSSPTASGSDGAGATSAKANKKMSKSSKMSKAGLLPGEDMFYITPFSCANKCLDAPMEAGGELNDAVVDCHNDMASQKWIIHQDEYGTFVKIESHVHEGFCISVDYEESDSETRIEQACSNYNNLRLYPCESDAANWYFTGGQLLSGFCWMNGMSTNMGVFSDEYTRQCSSAVETITQSSGAFVRDDTFMFFNSESIDHPDSPGLTDDGYADDDLFNDDEGIYPTWTPTLSPTLSSTLVPTSGSSSTEAPTVGSTTFPPTTSSPTIL